MPEKFNSNQENNNENEESKKISTALAVFPETMFYINTYNELIEKQKKFLENKENNDVNILFEDLELKKALFGDEEKKQEEIEAINTEINEIKLPILENFSKHLNILGLGLHEESFKKKINIEDSKKFFSFVSILKNKEFSKEEFVAFKAILELLIQWIHDVYKNSSNLDEKNKQLFFGEFLPDFMSQFGEIKKVFYQANLSFDEDLNFVPVYETLKNVHEFNNKGVLKEFSEVFLGNDANKAFLLEVDIARNDLDEYISVVMSQEASIGFEDFLEERFDFLNEILDKTKKDNSIKPIFLFYYNFFDRFINSEQIEEIFFRADYLALIEKMRVLIKNTKKEFDNINK